MSKVWREDHHIPWICNEDKEDFFATVGDYRLRVEQMSRKNWWWRVSYKKEAIGTILNEYASCRSSALNLAEGVYLGHQAAMRSNEQTIIAKLLAK